MACPYIVELAVVQVTPLALMTDHPCKLVPVFKILLIQAQVFLFVCLLWGGGGGGGGEATIISITCKLNLVGTSGHKSSACSTVISIILVCTCGNSTACCLVTTPGSLLLPPPLFSKPVAPPPSNAPLEEACSACSQH